jgi:chromosome segregation ATPase
VFVCAENEIEAEQHRIELKALQEELLESRDKLPELRDEVKDLQLQLDEARTRENSMRHENVELMMKLAKLEASFNDFNTQFHSHALDQSKDNIALESRCMAYESEVGLLLRHMETVHNDLKRNVLDKERELKVAKDIADETSKRSIEISQNATRAARLYECQLMECEDTISHGEKFFRKLKADAIKVVSTRFLRVV